MNIHLTPEQEERVQAVLGRGTYDSVEEIVEAGLVAVEQRAIADFDGTSEELQALLADGLGTKEVSEEDFWNSVNSKTDALLLRYESARP